MKKEEFATKILDAEKTLYHIAKSILKREEFFQTWLIRILINECYQMLRNKKEEVPYEEYLEKQDTYEIENTSELYQAVNELEETYRIPFILYYVEGFSIKEIGEILKVTKGTVKTRLYRARIIMKNKLEGEYGYEKY